jgi:hypothetical protein
MRPSGEPWRKSDQARPFARVVAAVGLDPAEVSLYALRHSSIVRQLMAGLPVRLTASLHDTSIRMIEAHYSRFISGHGDELARAAMLRIPAAAVDDVVVPLRGV